MRKQVLPRHRVVEPQAILREVQMQTQYAACQRRQPRRRLPQRHRHVRSPRQPQPPQRRRQVVTGRIVLPVLRHAQPLVQLPLGPLILPPRAARGDLQHEVRHLALAPHPVDPPVVVRHSQHHEYVRRHRRSRVALFVVDQQVAGDVHVVAFAPIAVVDAQTFPCVGQVVELKVAFRHRLAVGVGVLDHDRSGHRAAHAPPPRGPATA